MMLAHPQLDTVFDFSAPRVNTLVIENPTFLRAFLRDIQDQLDGAAGKAVLSWEGSSLEFSKHAELIDRYLSFSICKKSLLTKLLSRVEAAALDESHYMQTAQLMGDLERYIRELSFSLPCGIECDKLSIGGVLHSAGLTIADDYTSDLERLLDYMELTRELERDKLFLFVNLRSFYETEEIAAFCRSVLDHSFSVLLVDAVSREKFPEEARVTVDMDLCEF